MTHVRVLYAVIVLLLILLVSLQCGRNKDLEILRIDGKEGVFEDKNPIATVRDTVYEYSFRDTIIKYYNPVDTIYIEKFIKSDELKKTEIYVDAIGQRNYRDTLENKDIKISYDLNTIGKLSDIKIDYEIKPFTVEIPKPKETVFSMYAGASFQTTTELDKLEGFGNVGFQNKKGDIIHVGYGTNKTIQVGIMKRIFNVKK